MLNNAFNKSLNVLKKGLHEYCLQRLTINLFKPMMEIEHLIVTQLRPRVKKGDFMPGLVEIGPLVLEI